MCNRYTLSDTTEAFAFLAEILGGDLLVPKWVTPRYNVGLMQSAPTVVNRGNGAEVLLMNFGFFPWPGSKMLNNCRSETAFKLPSFKKAVVTHRCLIPTSGFIDWETDARGKKWPHLFTLASGRPPILAAIWNKGSTEHEIPPNFCIVTREPNELVARIHNRMPVILRQEHVARWLDPSPMADTEFNEICQSVSADEMREREISTYANNVRHEGPDCLGPPTPRSAPDAQLGLGF